MAPVRFRELFSDEVSLVGRATVLHGTRTASDIRQYVDPLVEEAWDMICAALPALIRVDHYLLERSLHIRYCEAFYRDCLETLERFENRNAKGQSGLYKKANFRAAEEALDRLSSRDKNYFFLMVMDCDPVLENLTFPYNPEVDLAFMYLYVRLAADFIIKESRSLSKQLYGPYPDRQPLFNAGSRTGSVAPVLNLAVELEDPEVDRAILLEDGIQAKELPDLENNESTPLSTLSETKSCSRAESTDLPKMQHGSGPSMVAAKAEERYRSTSIKVKSFRNRDSSALDDPEEHILLARARNFIPQSGGDYEDCKKDGTSQFKASRQRHMAIRRSRFKQFLCSHCLRQGHEIGECRTLEKKLDLRKNSSCYYLHELQSQYNPVC